MQKFLHEFSLLAAAGAVALGLIISAIIIALTGFTVRNIGPATNSATGEKVLTNTISVSATGEATIKPDQANISVQVSEKAATSEEALAKANQKINQLRDIFSKRVPAEKMKTTGLSIRSEYDYTKDGRQLLGQVATQSLNVEINNIKEDASDVAALIDQIGKVNGVIVNSIQFGVEDEVSALSEARNDAITKARKKAEELAKSLGVSVGAAVSVSEGNSGSYSPPMYFDASDSARAESDGGNTNISPGEQDVSISVSVIFAIK